MLRRHFFLVSALTVLVLMVAAAGLKFALGGKGPSGANERPGAASSKAGGSAGGRSRGGMGGPTQVSSVTVQPRTFVDAIEVLGVAKGRQSVTLSAATTQLVQTVHIHDGEMVRKGDVLVELKSTEQDAGLAQAQAKLVEAERAFERWKTLGEKGFASKASIDQYEAAYISAKADVEAARARQGDRVIRAPFSGEVGLTDIAPGALINPGAAIVTLDDLSTIRVDFAVPERYMADLHEGQQITATVDAYPGEIITGQVAKLDTRVNETTRAITARAEFPNPGHRLKPGMLVRVSIAHGQRQSPAAPETALAVEGDSAFVYLIANQDGKMVAEQRAVVTGARKDGFVELREGVAPGDRIVADGLNKVTPGQPIRLAGAGAGAGGGVGGGGQARPRPAA
ncbi:efflux RND transporter periplasmic adaptor subunit [Phenylobacterium sp.]|uniref:efflux RND transporter periplasmic adaptor subunit n=1 Tax=Phenylobacterium sp. TaxID=1871053 RepID=UPI0035B31C4B